MKPPLILLALIFAVPSFSQGIQFETGSWQSVVAKAKAEKKLIYIDAYTTWCGPCKLLEKNIFPKPATGNKFNPLFVNYRFDAEKGEGLALARQYNVSSYPTHLFIDPKTEAVVYRGSGYSPDEAFLIGEADIAMLEYQDPMTWEKYERQFDAGKRDTAFLRTFLNKALRLGRDNDRILNAYVAALGNQPAPAAVDVLAGYITTVDNAAVPLVAERWKALPAAERVARQNELKRWIYQTYSKATRDTNEGLLTVVNDALLRYTPEEAEKQRFFFAAEYYAATGAHEKAFLAAGAEAGFLAAQRQAHYDREDSVVLAGFKANVLHDLAEAKVPANKIDTLMTINLAKNPGIDHVISHRAAGRINSAAWQVWERSRVNTDTALVHAAIIWSARSLELIGKGHTNWPSFADTYAHLLYAAGRRSEAVAVQQQAVDATRSAKGEGLAGIEDALARMKAGTL